MNVWVKHGVFESSLSRPRDQHHRFIIGVEYIGGCLE